MWIIYLKAGKSGWEAIIPVYNIVVLLKIIGKPWWWILLLIIPILNVYISFKIFRHLALSFDIQWDISYAIFVHLFPFVLLPYLAFSKRYCGPAILFPTSGTVLYENYPE